MKCTPKTEQQTTIYKCNNDVLENTPPPKILGGYVHLTSRYKPDFMVCGITPNNDYIYSVREKKKGENLMNLLLYDIQF